MHNPVLALWLAALLGFVPERPLPWTTRLAGLLAPRDAQQLAPWRRHLSLSLREAAVLRGEATLADQHQLAFDFVQLSRFDRALPHFRLAQRRASEKYGEDSVQALQLLDYAVKIQALVYGPAGSRAAFEELLVAKREAHGPASLEVADALHSLAVVSGQLGDLESARRYYEDAVPILATFPPGDDQQLELALTLHELAAVYEQLGRSRGAQACLEEALRILIATRGVNAPDTAKAMQQLAGVLLRHGYRSEAILLLEHALAVQRGIGPQHRDTALAMLALASALWETGDLARVERLLSEALVIAGDDAIAVELGLELGRLHLAAGATEEAWRALPADDRVRNRHGSDAAVRMTEHELFELRRRDRDRLDLRLAIAQRMDGSQPTISAYESVLRWKGEVTRAQREGRARLFDDDSPHTQALLEQLRGTLAATSPPSLVQNQPHARLRSQEEARARTEIGLQRRLTARERDGADIRFEQLRASLAADAAAIDFLVHRPWGPERSGLLAECRVSAWITRPNDAPPTHLDLGSADELERHVQSFFASLRRRRAVDAPELRSALWAPLAPHLKGVRQLLISPDGFLWDLSFAALPTADGGRLVERYTFTYCSDLARGAPLPAPALARTDSALVVCNVDYDASPAAIRSEWGSLPQTAGEGEHVFGRFARGKLLQGRRAGEAAIKRELGRHPVAHFAMHGSQRESDWSHTSLGALDAALLCSGVGRSAEGEDDYLTAEEVAWLDLRGVKLVVLSACDSGRGARRPGESPLSIRRALHIAGVRTVVSALWAIDDEPTRQLMELMYERLAEGETPAASLHSAQRELAREGHPPKTWGAFVLSAR